MKYEITINSLDLGDPDRIRTMQVEAQTSEEARQQVYPQLTSVEYIEGVSASEADDTVPGEDEIAFDTAQSRVFR